MIAFAKNQEILERSLKIQSLRVKPYFSNRYFEIFDPTTPEDFVVYCEALETERGKVIDSAASLKFGSSEYFVSLLLGYLDYCREGVVSPTNIFVQGFIKSIESGLVDQGLRYMLDDMDLVTQKVEKKYEDLDSILEGRLRDIPPIMLSENSEGKLRFKDSGGATIRCNDIDGHHRYFFHQLLSMPSIEYVIHDQQSSYESIIGTNYTL